MIETTKIEGLAGGMTALRFMFEHEIEIPLYRYKEYTVTLLGYDYKFYGKDNLAIGTFECLMDACEALVIYGNNLDRLHEKDYNEAHALFDYMIDLVFEIRGC